MDLKNHFKNLLRLVKMEREEDRNQYQQKMMHTSMEERKQEGICWYPVIVTQSRLGTGEKLVLSLEKTGDLDQRHVFQVGSSVSVFSNQGSKNPHASGVISFVREKKMKVVLNTDEEPEWLNQGKLGINLLFDESTYEEMESTMKKLIKMENNRTSELASILISNKPAYFKNATFIDYPNLNESQNQAVGQILAAKDLSIVHGPPGTGKTTTLIRAITEVVVEEKQVLVCAPSNAAVDLLVEKLAEKEVNVLRIGHPARITPKVVENSLDARIAAHPEYRGLKSVRREAEELRTKAGKYKRNYGYEERRQRKMAMQKAKKLKDEARMIEMYITSNLLDRAQVIACTLIGCNQALLKDRFFKTVFIDEAGQALEPACWIAILRANRVIMAGDHLQLPPTVKSLEAAKEGLSATLFEKTIQRTEASTMLEYQYRMQEDIMKFSSVYFYKGKLKTAKLITKRVADFEEGALFIDTAGCGFDSLLNEKTRSTYNKEEASFMLKHLTILVEEITLEKIRERNISIGIITPYKAQNEIINQLIPYNEILSSLAGHLEVNTVDAFQGQERDIIYIGFVRSNPEREIGFLKDIRRTNVAMTRAKHKLVMVGDSATLGNLEFYNRMTEHFQTNGGYHSAFEFMEY